LGIQKVNNVSFAINIITEMAELQDIDISLLRTFVSVSETKRMTAAARIVHRTQSAVSQQIKRLETQFGSALFDRKAGAVHLTRDGEKLLIRARQLIALNDEVVDQMRGADFIGEVRLGVAHDVVRAMMPPILQRFHQSHPNVLITLVSDTTVNLRSALREETIDLALLTESERGNRCQFLMTDRLVWIGVREGEAYRRRPLSVALGRKTCIFRTAVIEALTRARVPWRSICQEGSLEAVFATLEADMAVAVFLSRTVPEGLVPVRDRGLPSLPSFHLNLRSAADRTSPAAEELANHIRSGIRSRYA
jgi:DNA-binding transcriptional LysR family regulator